MKGRDDKRDGDSDVLSTQGTRSVSSLVLVRRELGRCMASLWGLASGRGGEVVGLIE